MNGRAAIDPRRRGRPLEVLRRMATRDPVTRAGEVCEMCARPIEPSHRHVVDTESRNLLCACRPCTLLFAPEGAANGRYRAVPERVLHHPGFALGDALWERLQIPVRMAFFFFNSSLRKVAAFYPSPAGATESALDLAAWGDLVRANPLLADLQPDVEALLVFGRRGEPFQCFVVPIDVCYELTGLVKRHWKGFDGGEDARREIEAFFERLRARAFEGARRA